jgi:hypothetical protein
MDDRAVDELVSKAGRRWRATLPPPPDLDVLVAGVENRRKSRLLPLASLAVTVTVAAVILGSLVLRQRSTSPVASPGLDWTSSDYQAATVHPGDRVTATGMVIAYPGEHLEICLPGAVAGVGGGEPHAPFACGLFRAPLDGLDQNTLPGRSEAGGAVYSPSRLTVQGTWTGTSITVSSVDVATSEPPASSGGIPCPTPAVGWPKPPADLEEAVRPLSDAITAHPDQYSAYWGGDSGGLTPTLAVAIVGTVGDPDAVRPALESVYPYGVCVVKVKYSATDLQGALDALSAKISDRTLGAMIDPELDRVRVELTIVTRELATLLEANPEIVPQPLITGRS